MENIAIKQPCKDEFMWYLIKEGIAGTVFLPSYKGTLIERPEYSLRRWIDEIRTTILKGVCSCLDRSTQALYASLFLGNRSAKKDELDKVADEFRAWGISHYLARSGLHMVIFASLWSLLLNMLPLANIVKILLLCIITALYATLSWSSISFIRALSAFVAYKLYSLLRIPAHSIHVFSLVCYFVLLDNPTQLFFLDFQLSFGLTFGIAWFYHTYGAYLRRLKSMQYTRTVE
jgi:competence protein ComEC